MGGCTSHPGGKKKVVEGDVKDRQTEAKKNEKLLKQGGDGANPESTKIFDVEVDEKGVIEISAEERALDGAPQTELFTVHLITSRHELPKPTDTSTSLAALRTAFADNETWNVSFNALTTFRSMLFWEFESIKNSMDVNETFISGISRCIRSLRSVLARNAIIAAEDLFFRCTELQLSQKSVDSLIYALLDACATNMPKAIRMAASQALNQACETGPWKKLVPALVTRASHKNKDIVEASMVYSQKVISIVATKNRTFAIELDVEKLLLALHFGLNAKSPAAKNAARAQCGMICNSIGKKEWEMKVSKVSDLTAVDIEDMQNAGIAAINTQEKSTAKDAAADRKAQLKALREKVSGRIDH